MNMSFVVVEGRELELLLSDCIQTKKITEHVRVVDAGGRYSAVSLARTLLMNRPGKVAVAIRAFGDRAESGTIESLEIEQALADVAENERFGVFSFSITLLDSAGQDARSPFVAQLLKFLSVDPIAHSIDKSKLMSKSLSQLIERRSSLINKRFAEGLTPEEELELESLTQTVDEYVSKMDRRVFAPARRLQRRASRLLSKQGRRSSYEDI
ncbi:MAG: hypothetical protein IH987_14385 [Planctomycetes bacterium]|nr:hypothetical protein [Planctomycetota bacterium]